jgi:hypothetical protein
MWSTIKDAESNFTTTRKLYIIMLIGVINIILLISIYLNHNNNNKNEEEIIMNEERRNLITTSSCSNDIVYPEIVNLGNDLTITLKTNLSVNNKLNEWINNNNRLQDYIFQWWYYNKHFSLEYKIFNDSIPQDCGGSNNNGDGGIRRMQASSYDYLYLINRNRGEYLLLTISNQYNSRVNTQCNIFITNAIIGDIQSCGWQNCFSSHSLITIKHNNNKFETIEMKDLINITV